MPQRLRLWCYPDYIDEDKLYMPLLTARLRSEGIELEIVRWNGEISTLPRDRKVAVRYSAMLDVNSHGYESRPDYNLMAASGKDAILGCHLLGHVMCYNDRLIKEGDKPSSWRAGTGEQFEELWEALQECIENE